MYGTTAYGGGNLCNGTGCGTVFQLARPSSGSTWTETVLYAFQGGSDGEGPMGGLIFDAAGNLYGTTFNGGNTACLGGCGTIFQLSPPSTSGGSWTKAVLYGFDGKNNGGYPYSTLAFDKRGNLYGTTASGGVGPNGGTAFRASATLGSWAVTVLHSFQRGNDGAVPVTGLTLDNVGKLYGTTMYGGGGRCYNGGVFGCGTVFELLPPSSFGGTWIESQIATFPSGLEGRYPEAGLIFDGSGNLYGTTALGGVGRYGDVFELTPPATQGGAWTRTVLYYFQGGSDGRNPQGNLLLLNGSLYGTTNIGGEVTCSVNGGQGCGTLFKIVP